MEDGCCDLFNHENNASNLLLRGFCDYTVVCPVKRELYDMRCFSQPNLSICAWLVHGLCMPIDRRRRIASLFCVLCVVCCVMCVMCVVCVVCCVLWLWLWGKRGGGCFSPEEHAFFKRKAKAGRRNKNQIFTRIFGDISEAWADSPLFLTSLVNLRLSEFSKST